MAYMLSAQLAAMELNVQHGKITGGGNALVYGGDCIANYFPGSNGFITINALMTAANTSLCGYGSTPAGHPQRAYQECLKTTLDQANNNFNFVQSQPCSPFTCAH
jgi:large exoprotein involved in heme utilization and adhesion